MHITFWGTVVFSEQILFPVFLLYILKTKWIPHKWKNWGFDHQAIEVDEILYHGQDSLDHALTAQNNIEFSICFSFLYTVQDEAGYSWFSIYPSLSAVKFSVSWLEKESMFLHTLFHIFVKRNKKTFYFPKQMLLI